MTEGEIITDNEGEKVQVKSVWDYLFYKLDRNLAIAGIIAIGVLSILRVIAQEGQQLPGTAITALATYVGIRSGK